MNRFIPEKTLKMEPYEPEDGLSEVRLDVNESFISLPEELRARAANVAAEALFNRYPDPFASRACAAFGGIIGVSPEYITAGNGSDELISIIVNTFLARGDRMMTIEPDFSMYRFYAYVAGIECHAVGKPESLRTDLGALYESIARVKPKLLAFSNPCSPTGQGIARADMLALVDSFDGIVLLDEAYMDFWDQSLLDVVCERDNLIILKTCSKAYGLAAIRLGFAVTNRDFTEAIRKVKSPFNVDAVSGAIASLVLGEKKYIANCIESIIKSRDVLYNGLKEREARHPDAIRVFPTVTNFVAVSSPSAPALHRALKDRGICVRLIGGRYLRITAGSGTENARLLSALDEILSGGLTQ